MKILSKKIDESVKSGTLFLFFLSLFFTLSPFPFPLAHAQAPVRSFTIVPPSVLTPLNPGESAEGTLKMRNDTDEAVTFDVSVQDFVVNDTNGTPTILPPGTLSGKYSAASWIGVSPTKFIVPARDVQELTYFMRIPQDARPGGHYAAVVYSPVNDKELDSTGATVNSQIGTLFSVVVDGPMTENALITRFFAPGFAEYGPVPVQTQIKNMSDSHIRPLGTITVTNMLGGKTTQPLKENNIFPEAARDYVNIMGEKWMFGRYVATLQGTYGKDNGLPLAATVVFWVFPWKIVVVIILFIVAGVLGYMLMKKKRKGGDPTPPTVETTERKSVEEIEAEREAGR